MNTSNTPHTLSPTVAALQEAADRINSAHIKLLCTDLIGLDKDNKLAARKLRIAKELEALHKAVVKAGAPHVR